MNWLSITEGNSKWVIYDHNIASVVQGFLDTRSLMHFSSTEKSAYHTYRQHLSRRLVSLFGLTVSSNASHREVMEALIRLPKGESGLAISELNSQIDSDRWLENYVFPSRRRVHYQIVAKDNPFETREGLIKICETLWMRHAEDAARYLHRVQDPSTLRLLATCGHQLKVKFPEEARAKELECSAQWLLALQGQISLDQFRAVWNGLTLCEQAKALSAIGHSLTSIRDLNHPVVPLVYALVQGDGFDWKDKRMQNFALEIVKIRKEQLEGTRDPFTISLLAPLSDEICNGISLEVNEEIREHLLGLLPKLSRLQGRDEAEAFARDCRAHIIDLNFQSESPQAHLLTDFFYEHEHPHLEKALASFRKNWRNLDIAAQVSALLTFGEVVAWPYAVPIPMTMSGTIRKFLKDFVESDLLGWKDMRLQKAASYLMRLALNRPLALPHGAWGPYGLFPTLRDIGNAAIRPGYKNELDTILRILSNIIDCCEKDEGLNEALHEWQEFKAQFDIKTLAELSLIKEQELP